jgi:hypothetical protein
MHEPISRRRRGWEASSGRSRRRRIIKRRIESNPEYLFDAIARPKEVRSIFCNGSGSDALPLRESLACSRLNPQVSVPGVLVPAARSCMVMKLAASTLQR